MTDEEVIKDYWKWEKEMKSKITQAHTDGYNRGYAKRKEEIKLLGERCNQLLKDKGDLTDKNKQLELIILGNQEELENQAVAYETLKLHDQEEIGMLNSKVTELENKIADIKANCDLAIEGRDVKIKELELELTVEKDQHQEEINLHLHAEDYIKELERLNSNQAESLRVTMLEEEKKGKRIEELEKDNEELRDNYEQYKAVAEPTIKELKAQIEKMKRHCNCKHRDSEGYCEVKRTYLMDLSYDGCDKWELED